MSVSAINFEDIYRYRGLIFDLDGTLINSMPWHTKAWIQVCAEHGFTIDPKIIYQLGGMASRNIVMHFKEEGKNVGDVDAFVRRKVELYRANLDKVELFAPIAAILRTAKARGLKCAVGTGTQRINATDILKIHHLTDLVDVIVSADDVTRHKPHPDTFLKAAELLGLTPAECLVFDDGPVGLAAAKNGHMDCVEVLNGTLVNFFCNTEKQD